MATTTVKQLIEELQCFDESLPVMAWLSRTEEARDIHIAAESVLPRILIHFDSDDLVPLESVAALKNHEPGSAVNMQVGGDHYLMPIQPIEFITKNNLGFIEGNIVKYICRHRKKGKANDLRKVIHYARLLLNLEYGVND